MSSKGDALQKIDKAIAIAEAIAKECGAGSEGAPGFGEGNTCARGRGNSGSAGSASDDGPMEPHPSDAKAIERKEKAATVGGNTKTVTIDGKEMQSAMVFYEPDISLGGYKSSRVALLGDHIEYAGEKGKLEYIDPKGKSLRIGGNPVAVRDPEIDWKEIHQREKERAARNARLFK